ncbi:regulatory protein LuxO [Photobacterium aphoticum]|nr:regulatory protein LuxO [Photobacterium aphoticum]
MSLEEGKNFSRFSPEVLTLFKQYHWQGNVRELQNVIRNIVVLNNGEEVTLPMVPPPINNGGVKIASSTGVVSESVLDEPQVQQTTAQQAVVSQPVFSQMVDKSQVEPLWVVEKRAIQAAIDACDGNIPRAAGLLEVSPSTIYRKLQTWQEAQG